MPTAPPPSRDAAIETLVFWERFKNEIIGALIVVLLAVVGFTGYRFYSDRQAAAASALLASAKSAQEYQQVITRYPNTPASADSYLLLAEAEWAIGSSACLDSSAILGSASSKARGNDYSKVCADASRDCEAVSRSWSGGHAPADC